VERFTLAHEQCLPSARAIVENCGNTLILRCGASEQGGTAHFASRLIGEREIVRVHESRSRQAGSWESSRTTRLEFQSLITVS